MHAKYEASISYGSKVIANVKVDNRQTYRQTDTQRGQKQYAPDHSIRGIKTDGTKAYKYDANILISGHKNKSKWSEFQYFIPEVLFYTYIL